MSIILKQLSKERQNLLKQRGLSPADMVHGRDSYDVAEGLTKFETDLPGMSVKPTAAPRQLRGLEKVLENPLRGNYVMVISSFPSDLRAKHLATHIFDVATTHWYKHHKAGRDLPLWHRIYGGLNEPLRDRVPDSLPSMLVLSNINDQSTNFKLEKLRDLLERYDGLPRIVVVGSQSPLAFFSQKLHYPVNYSVLLGPENRLRET